ncbi:MAG: hypothetical protein ACI8S6_002595 [Myxococcota bacterium]|jgi:hypothetical protein
MSVWSLLPSQVALPARPPWPPRPDPTRPWCAAPHQRVGGPRAGARSRESRARLRIDAQRQQLSTYPPGTTPQGKDGVKTRCGAPMPSRHSRGSAHQNRRRATAASARGQPRKGTARRCRAACRRIFADELASGDAQGGNQVAVVTSSGRQRSRPSGLPLLRGDGRQPQQPTVDTSRITIAPSCRSRSPVHRSSGSSR